MERFGWWIWEHHRERFILLVGVAAVLALNVVLVLPSVVMADLYLDLDLAVSATWFASLLLVNLVAVVLTAVQMQRAADPIRRWAAGEEADADATWSALVAVPQTLAWRSFLAFLPPHLGVTFPLALWMADLAAPGVVGLALGYVLVTGASGALIVTIAQLVVRPAIVDVGARVQSFAAQMSGSWTIRRRLVIVTFVVVVLAAVAGPLIVLGAAVDDRDFVLVIVGGSALSVYACWLLDAGLFRPTIVPVTDLIAGADRVRRGDLTTSAPVSSLDELGSLAIAFNGMQVGLRQREALQVAFGSYVDPHLAQRLVDSGSALFEGEDVVVTVLFADVRDFTSYAEGVAPAVAVERLNRLFDVLVPVLHEHGGHANHYLGDGLLAVFGAPQPLLRHADGAVAAAVEMSKRVRAEFGDDLRLGIGVNTGPVIAGTVGGGGRHEFTVIGDPVNTASRVEQLTKDTGDAILITEATRDALSVQRPSMSPRGEFEIRGRLGRLTLYAIDPFAVDP